jgi:hypothetical protein
MYRWSVHLHGLSIIGGERESWQSGIKKSLAEARLPE